MEIQIDREQIQTYLSKKRANYLTKTINNQKQKCYYALPVDVRLFDTMLEADTTTCNICGGRWHVSDCCGNTFMMNKIVQTFEDHFKEAWYAIKYEMLKRKPEYCRDKCLENEKKFDNGKKFKLLKDIPQNDSQFISAYYDGLRSNYECIFCKGKGHIFPECSVKWLLNKKYKNTNYSLGAAWSKMKLKFSKIYEAIIEKLNEDAKKQIDAEVSEEILKYISN